MRTKKFKSSVAVFLFIVFVFILGSCDVQQGIEYGNMPIDMNSWSWSPILFSLAAGFLLGLAAHRSREW